MSDKAAIRLDTFLSNMLKNVGKVDEFGKDTLLLDKLKKVCIIKKLKRSMKRVV